MSAADPVGRDEVFLRHILEALERIVAYTREGRDVFVREPMVQDATLRNLEIIGEATKSLSPAFRTSHPEVPRERTWRGCATSSYTGTR